MASSSSEVVHEGWLVKSPPNKPLWRAKWRRRWFVLKHSGELPGQYYLEYYTDSTYRKLKGKIDLDQCIQVDTGLMFEGRKQNYPFMFDIFTPKRVYFLATDTEEDMNKWVICLCQVCGLKMSREEDRFPASTQNNKDAAMPLDSKSPQDTPPTSPHSFGSSGPYFPLSECISGIGPPMFVVDSASNEFLHQSFHSVLSSTQPSSAPVTPMPSRGTGFSGSAAGSQSLRSKPGVRREDWSLAYDQPRTIALFPLDSNATHGSNERNPKSYKRPTPPPLNNLDQSTGAVPPPPPRPPKPAHLAEPPSHNNSNMDQLATGKSYNKSFSPISPTFSSGPSTPHNADDWYDIPRFHQPEEKNATGESRRRHCYTNAAPGEMSQPEIFTFQNNNNWAPSTTPNSHTTHSPPPLLSPSSIPSTPMANAPSVNRTLKPRMPLVNSTATGTRLRDPPSVNRQLKPNRNAGGSKGKFESHGSNSIDGDYDASSRNSSRPNSAHEDDQYYFFTDGAKMNSGKRRNEIQYLDLDLESDGSIQSPKSPERAHQQQSSSTVYKTVDFVKTEALNITKKDFGCRYQNP